MCADNVSSGIEPVFKHKVERTINFADGPRQVVIEDYGKSCLKVMGGKTYDQVTAKEHLNVLKVATKYVDSSVSKTCNVPSDLPWNEFKDLYVDAWKAGCKGLTTFQPEGKRQGIIKEAAACVIDPESGLKECG